MARRTFKPTVIESLETRTVPSHLTPVKVNPVHEASVAPKHTAAPTHVNAKSAHASANSSSSVTNAQLNAAVAAAQAQLAAQQQFLTYISTQTAIVSAQVAALSAVVLSENGGNGGGGGGGGTTSPTAAQTDVAMNFSGFANLLVTNAKNFTTTTTAFTAALAKDPLTTDATAIAKTSTATPPATASDLVSSALAGTISTDATKLGITAAQATTLSNDAKAFEATAAGKAGITAQADLNKADQAAINTLATNLLTSLASTGTSTSVLNFVRQSITGVPVTTGVTSVASPTPGSLQAVLLGTTNPTTGKLATGGNGGLSHIVTDTSGNSINELERVTATGAGPVEQAVDSIEIPILFAASPNSTLPAVAFPGS